MIKTFVNSLPKAGTHLLETCLLLFGYTKIKSIGSFLVLNKTPDALQRESLQRLFQWLDLPNEKIDYVAGNLFGPGLHTFRKGQVNSWKKEAPKSMLGLMDSELADILKTGGYQ